jgi:hypothetical protein
MLNLWFEGGANMLVRDFQDYVYSADDDAAIGVVIHSAETRDKIAVTYDVSADINKYGELMIHISL